MTSRGEPAPDQRPRRTRALALLGALAVSAGLATWAEVQFTGGGSSDPTNANGSSYSQDMVAPASGAGAGASAAPSSLPDATGVLPATIDVPGAAGTPGTQSSSGQTSTGQTSTGQNSTGQNSTGQSSTGQSSAGQTSAGQTGGVSASPSSGFAGFQATRYALGTSSNCADVLVPTAPTGVTTSCEGYVAASYVSADHSVMASVTVLGYPDAATARRAKPLFGASGAASTVALFRQPGNELPGVTSLPGTEQQRVQQVGRFVTVVQTASVSGSPAAAPATLLATEYGLSAEVGDSVLWDE